MSDNRRDLAHGRAQAVVEFALVLPLFVLLLFGLIDFGRLEFTYISLANAAREMTRAAAISGNSSDTVVDSYNNFAGLILSPPSASDKITITVTDRSCTETPSTCAAAAHTPNVLICNLPMTHASCVLPPTWRTGLAGGSVDIVATNRFTFNPVFENRLTGMIDATFADQWATLSTTARAYIE